MNNEDRETAYLHQVSDILNELRDVLAVTHEYHEDLRSLRKLMNEFDDCNYGSNLS